jgi:two-component SAPR family response regulator/LysM repeat protein
MQSGPLNHHLAGSLPVERRGLRLFGLIALVGAAAIGLIAVRATPRLPAGTPGWHEALTLLTGSALPLELMALLLVDAAWLLWLWIVFSLVVQLLLAGAAALSIDSTRLDRFHHLADRVTVPFVRNIVAAAFAVQVLARGVPMASAAPLPDHEFSLVLPLQAGLPEGTDGRVEQGTPESATYVVQPGDTLWSIAERAYGTGAEYRRLVDANVGRPMLGAGFFTARGVIQPGWELLVPDAQWGGQDNSADAPYIVQPGDTLSAIARTRLGDASRWSELFVENRGTRSGDGSRELEDPDLIWPGLSLRLTADSELHEDGAPADSTDPASAVPPPVEDPEAPEQSSTSHADAVPESDGVELVAAAAPSSVPAPSPPDPAFAHEHHAHDADPRSLLESATPAAAPLPEASPTEVSTVALPPLLRTVHAFDPIVLEPSDSVPEADSPPPPDADSSTGAPTVSDQQLPEAAPGATLPLGGLAVGGGVGLVGVAAIAFGARRLRKLRPLPEQPESDVVVEGGFAEAALTQEFATPSRGPGYDPVLAIVSQVWRFLDQYHLSAITLVAVRHGRSSTTLSLASNLADQTILVDLAPTLSTELHSDVETWVSADRDLMLRLSGTRKTRLLPPAAHSIADLPRLLPLGVLYDRQTFSVAWEQLGHVLVASLPGHGSDTILTSLVAALTARESPAQTRLWLVARPRNLASPLFALPHVDLVLDPDDHGAMAELVQRLRMELDRRSAADVDIHEPELVVVVPELADLGEHASSIELFTSGAIKLGVRFLAATGAPRETAASPIASRFGTRMVLRMEDEETSVSLLGTADAAFLGGGGRLLVRVDDREPVELYGYQVSNDHLERLVRVMRSGHATTGEAPKSRAHGTPPGRAAAPPDVRRDWPSEFDGASTDAQSDPAKLHHASPGPALDASPVAAPENPVPVSDQPRPGPSASMLESRLPQAPPASLATATAGARRNGKSRPSKQALPSLTTAAAVAEPPLRVICFGGPRVMCGDRQIWPNHTRGEAKCWELLLFLCCQPPEGIATDRALEALWPEQIAEDPGHRIRTLRYRLRNVLRDVPGAPESDGISLDRGMMRLHSTIVWSDASEFLEKVRRARTTIGAGARPFLERVRELYQGDLLIGPDARRYAWADDRDESGVTLREHFRRQYQHASARLADLYVESNDPEAALHLLRDLTESDPGDERLWRALFRVHAQRRDRPSLILEEGRYRHVLRERLGDVDGLLGADDLELGREIAEEYQRLLESLRDTADRDPAPMSSSR